MGSQVVLPGQPDYRNAVDMFVALFDNRTPMLVLYASNEETVVTAVKFANQYNLKLSARSGGNSNLGWGTCNGCLVVDVSNMTSIELYPHSNQARVGPGVSNRMLTDNISTNGLAVPQGDCPMVRVGGYTVGGGLTLTARTLGLNIDAVIEIRAVGANGTLLVTNANENADLFWALRGGSGINFGIVTSLLFQAKPMPQTILGGHLSFNMTEANAAAVAGLMYDYIWGAGDPVEHRPFGFSLVWGSTNDGGLEFKLMGLWFSDNITMGRSILDRFAALPGMTQNAITEGTFDVVMQPLMDQYLGFGGLNWTMPDAMIKPPSSRATFTSFATTVTRAALGRPVGSALGWVFAPLGGRVAEIPVDYTAFPHRHSAGNFHMPTVWLQPSLSELVREFGQSTLELTREWWMPNVDTSSGDPPTYVNHPSEYLNNYATSYWGSNLPRLQQVKAKYDPRNFLSNGQGIIVSSNPGVFNVNGNTGSTDDGVEATLVALTIVAVLVIVGAYIVSARHSGSQQ